jgi:hypothetical protein
MLAGGCLCGGVRFEVTEAPAAATYCHCRRCQRRTGTAASAQARLAPGSLRVVQGENLLRTYTPAEGGRETVFCSVCGSALFSRAEGRHTSVRLGAFDGDPGVRPAWRQWVSSAGPWEPLPDDGLPRYDELAPPMASSSSASS